MKNEEARRLKAGTFDKKTHRIYCTVGSKRQEGEQKSQDTEARLPPELEANIELELGIAKRAKHKVEQLQGV
jgi:hypothetical protein